MKNKLIFSLQRAVARMTDYLIWGMGTVALFPDKVELLAYPYFLLGSFCVFIFAEALMVYLFKTTPGKALMGIFISAPDGGKLTFWLSLKRAFLAFGVGMGFFLPYISLVFPFVCLYGFVKFGTTYWDKVSDSRVEKRKTSIWSKILLILFYVLLAFGMARTIQSAIQREIDLPGVEQEFMLGYLDEVRPMLIETLSEKALHSPQAVRETAKNLKEIQDFIQEKTEKYEQIKADLQARVDALPKGEFSDVYRQELEDQSERVTMFLFTESIRVSLFENIVGFFESAENKYRFEDGRPVFDNEELGRQYDNYMAQLEAFLSAQEDDVSAVPDRP